MPDAPIIDLPGVRIPEAEHQAAGNAIQQSVSEAIGQPAAPVIPVTAQTPVEVNHNPDKIVFAVDQAAAPAKKEDKEDGWFARLKTDLRSVTRAIIRIGPSKKGLDTKIGYISKKEDAKNQANPNTPQPSDGT